MKRDKKRQMEVETESGLASEGNEFARKKKMFVLPQKQWSNPRMKEFESNVKTRLWKSTWQRHCSAHWVLESTREKHPHWQFPLRGLQMEILAAG